MKMTPLVWPGMQEPHPTVVLHKRELDTLLDIPTRNPRSQQIGFSLGRRSVYVCDGRRILCCTADKVGTETGCDTHYIPLSAVKPLFKAMKMTTAIVITYDGENQYRVAALETENKAWDLVHGSALLDHGTIVTETVCTRVELGPAVPTITLMEDILTDLARGANEGPKASNIRFFPKELATFGKLAKLGPETSAIMYMGDTDTDAALFEVSAGDTQWRYALMPAKPTTPG